MSKNIYVEVEPVAPTTAANCVRNACNRVKVSVDYMKGRGIVASAYPAEVKDGINSILITSGEYANLAPAPRLNRKQVETWQKTAENHVALRQDVVWDLVLKTCRANGLTPKVTQ